MKTAATVCKLLPMLVLVPLMAASKPWWLNGSTAGKDDFLAPDAAFRPSATVDGNTLHLDWIIADGYYLYRSRFRIEAESPGLVVEPATFPRGTLKTDPYLGAQEIFTQSVEATVPFQRHDFGAHPLQFRITYQGCAEAGLCYPPIMKVIFPTAGGTVPAARGATVAAAVPHSGAMLRRVAMGGRWMQRSSSWVGISILGGGIAFLIAGFVLRRGRRLDFPST